MGDEKFPEDSVILAANLIKLQSVPATSDSLDSAKVAELAKNNPELAALIAHNKQRERKAKDEAQDAVIAALTRKQAESSASIKELQDEIKQWKLIVKGAGLVVVVLWSVVNWVVPKLFSEKDAKAAICRRVSDCISNNDTESLGFRVKINKYIRKRLKIHHEKKRESAPRSMKK